MHLIFSIKGDIILVYIILYSISELKVPFKSIPGDNSKLCIKRKRFSRTIEKKMVLSCSKFKWLFKKRVLKKDFLTKFVSPYQISIVMCFLPKIMAN